MENYYINSDKGKEIANSLQVGAPQSASDGSIWMKQSDGSIRVIKNGQIMTGQVGASPSASTTPETPVLDAANAESASRSPLYPSAESVFGQQQETQTPKPTASETAKDATKAVTEGLYTIGTELGMSYVNGLKNAGDTRLMSDGYTLKREDDGSYSVSKGDSSAKVHIDNDAVRRDTLLNEAIRSASQRGGNAYTVGTEKGLDLLQQAKDTGSSVWASDNTEWSYDRENGGFYTNLNGVKTPITVDKEAVNREYARKRSLQKTATENVAPSEQGDGERYVIGSAEGVYWAASEHRPGDRLLGRDKSIWTWNGYDDVTVEKNGKTYKATIDREAAKRDPQWAVLTAPPVEEEEASGKKSKKKSSGTSSGSGSSGSLNTYFSGASTSAKKETTQAASGSTGGDIASLRKKAASAQKDMADIARQIAAKKAQGKTDTAALEAKYAEAKDRYDKASAQVTAAKAPKNEGPTLLEAATSAPAKRAAVREAVQKEAWRSLPTVADADRFSINKAADAQTREAEQQFFASARRELQRNAWRGLPTVQDSERFSIPSQTDSLMQQAIAQAPRTLSGKPYLPENDGGFSHSSGTSKSVKDRLAAQQMNIAMANDDYDTIRRIREQNNYLDDNESFKYLAGRAKAGLLGAIQGVGNALSYLFQAKEPEGYDWDNPVMTGEQFAESVSGLKQTFSFADTDAQKFAQRYAGRNIPAAQRTAGSVAEGVAGMIPTIASNIAVPGSSLYVLFTQAAGSATTDALQRGASGQNAVAYGVANGALEVLTEKMFDGVAGVFGKGAADDALQSLVRRVTQNEGAQNALLTIADSLGEGFEEFVSEFGDKVLADLLLKDDDRSFRAVLSDAGDSFLVGALTSAVMQAAGSITKNTTPKQAAEKVNDILQEDIQQESINANVREAAQQSALDRGMLETMRPEAFQAPAWAELLDTQQTTQGAAERGTDGVITGGEVNKNASTYTEAESTSVNDNVVSTYMEAGGGTQAPNAVRPGNTSGTSLASSPSAGFSVPQPGNSVNQNISPNDMGAMRSQFESVPKQSQTQSNTIGSMEADWNVPESQRTPIMYDTISEAKSLDNARLRLAQDYAGEMAELRGKHNWSGEEVDMGMTILDNYRRAAEQTGDWTEYSNWRKEVSAHGTAAGQALQAYAKYSRQTGGGIVADASAALERAAKKTNKAEIMNRVNTLAQQYDAAVGTGQENAKVNVSDLVDIIKSASTVRQTGTLIGNKTSPIVNWAMNRIANYARAEAQSGGGENLDFLKTFAADSIYNIAADTRTVSAGEKVKTVRRAGMLSKVSTVMRNLVSNNVFDPVDSVARNVSVPLDMLVSTITGTRSVAGDASWFSAAKRKGSMDGLARACMEVGLDVDTSGGAGKYENTANRTFKMSGGVFSKLMSTWEAYEGYTLNATDEFQKGGIEASVQQGIDRLYEKGKIKDDSLRDAGKQEALYRTFQDKTVLSDAAIGVRNALNKAHIGDVGAGDIVLPFAQVPSNLGARAIEYSPAGLIVSAADFINMLDSAKKGDLTAAQQAKAVQGIGRALTGSGMIAIAAAGALRGWLKVTGDDEDKNKDALGKTHGLDGTQLNISAALRDLRGESAEWQHGDTLLSIGFLDPLNAQLTTGALIADDIRSEDGVTAGRVLGNSLSGALQSVLDTPVMSTFQDVASSYEYSDASTTGGKVLDAAQKYAANQISSVIPNSLRGIAQGLDDTERNAYSSDNVWQQAVDNAKASIPGLRETLPAKTDVWGNPVKNEGGVRNFMNRNINPGNITTYKSDAVSSEIEKISEATGASLYPDRTAPRSIKVDGEAVSLTFEQRSMYQKAYGDAYSAAVTSLTSNKNYKAMPDSMKAEILKQARDVATEQARDSLGVGYEVKTSAQKVLEKSGEDRTNALISAAVKSQHYLSPETQEQRSKVDQQFAGADYVGLSDEIVDSAKEKADTYFTALEASKYGGELTETQKELSGKSSKELARYFMDEAINAKIKGADGETKFDKALAAYQKDELNDTLALAVLSDDAVQAYDRYGRSAGVTPEMMLIASSARANIKDETDEDGKVTNSAKDQFNAWLDKQWISGTTKRWTEDQKNAVRMAFYKDASTTYSYLSEQLRKGNINTATAKSELTSSYQSGWTHNVKDTGAEMADYIDAIVEYQERPSEDERKAAGYKNTWSWFCDYLNTTDLTQEQKYSIAISMSDYADSTKQKIWDRLR